MNFIVKLLLKLVVKWINAHPNSAFSRFMLRQRGPRTDVARMNRPQRLASALVFLLWGCLFLGLWLLVGYLTFGLRVLSQDNPLAQVLIFGLALLAGCGFLGGLYLLLRGVCLVRSRELTVSRAGECGREKCGLATASFRWHQ